MLTFRTDDSNVDIIGVAWPWVDNPRFRTKLRLTVSRQINHPFTAWLMLVPSPKKVIFGRIASLQFSE